MWARDGRRSSLVPLRALGAALLLLTSAFVDAVGAPRAIAATPSPDAAFVDAAYHDFLGRAPTSTELAAATQTSLATAAARAQVVAALSTSNEWVTKTVEMLYHDTLGRDGDAGGVTHWVHVLQAHKLSVASVAATFYASEEYFTHLGGGTSSSWVSRLYTKILGRPADSGGLAYWVHETSTVGRFRVAYAFFQSSESCHTRVARLFQQLLGRAPDPSGWDYWATKVASGGDLRLAAALASSKEYAEKAWAKYVATLAPPGAPTDVSGASGNMRVTVSWTAPASDGGAPVTAYEVTATPGGATCTTDGGTSCTVSGLANGTDYTFVVVATNAAGSGPASSASSAVTAGWSRVSDATATYLFRPASASDGGIIGSASGVPRSAAYCSITCTAPTPLASLPGEGELSGQATAISSTGEIVGTEGGPVAWKTPASVPTPLAVPEGFTAVTPVAVSSTGEILAQGQDAGGTEQLLVWASAGAAPTVLPNPAGYTFLWAIGLTESGEVVGTSLSSSGLTGLVWASPTSSPATLSVPNGDDLDTVYAVAPSGEVLGRVQHSSGSFDAVAWASSSATPTTLALPAGLVEPRLEAESASGEIIGTAHDAGGTIHGLVWSSASAAPTTLALPSGAGRNSISLVGVSSTGVVVGGVNLGSYYTGLRWSTAASAPALLPPVSETLAPTVVGTTAAGEVVGHAKGSQGQEQVWASPGATPVPLRRPSGDATVYAWKVLASGVVVGWGTDASGVEQALMWPSPQAAPTVLAAPAGFTSSRAIAVSSSGEIVGSGRDSGGVDHVVVWASSAASPIVLAVPDGEVSATPTAVSPSGEIVGVGADQYSNEQTYVWETAEATPTLLVGPPGSSWLTPMAVLASGEIVATYMSSTYRREYRVWASPSATPTALPAPDPAGPYDYTGINAMSASGEIVGWGYDSSGAQETLVWASPTASPEVLTVPIADGRYAFDTIGADGAVAVSESSYLNTWLLWP